MEVKRNKDFGTKKDRNRKTKNKNTKKKKELQC